MSEENIFNRRINRFLKEDPLSSASALIKTIKSVYPETHSYYTIFDHLCFDLKIHFYLKMILNYEMDKVVGYYPCIKYKNNNRIGESPREEYLTAKNLIPLSYTIGHDFLAENLVYRLMKIDDLEAKLRDS